MSLGRNLMKLETM